MYKNILSTGSTRR